MADKRKQFEGEIGGMPGQDISVGEAAQRIFNLRADEDYDARVVAMATSIHEIWADVKQPRRAVPASIRLHWNGNPDEVAELLNQWHIIAGKIAPIDLYAVLQGRGEGMDVEDAPAIFTEYVALLRLAASIAKDGLINPISIVEFGGKLLIETGERRWLAYHLLHANMGVTDWAKIPATRSNAKDSVWRQASENTARRSLNAIGMARQIALLIMEARRGLEGQEYNDFDELVLSGGCDRKFYAQVANGNIHRVPRGMGERITAAMGELSLGQIRNYRQLLRLTEDEQVNDALWVRADVENWAEGFIRDTVTIVTVSALKDIVTRENWGREDLKAAVEAARDPKPPVLPPDQLPQPEPPAPKYEPELLDKVRTPAGHIGTVVNIPGGRFVAVQAVNGLRNYDHATLTLVSRAREEEKTLTPAPSPSGRGEENAVFPSPVQRINLDDYPDVQGLGGWIMQYRALKRNRDVHELLFSQCAYGFVALWGDAEAAIQLVTYMGDKCHFEKTESGLAFFAKDYSVIEELAKVRTIALFKSYTDQASINTLWVKTMDKLKTQPKAPQVDEDEWSFQIGEAVAVNATGDVREVIFLKRGRRGEEIVTVQEASGHSYDIDAGYLTSLLVTYDEYVNQQQPKAAPQNGSDKNNSLITDEDRVVLERGSKEHQLYIKLYEIAVLYGYDEAADAAKELRDFTMADVLRIANVLNETRAMYHDLLIQTLSEIISDSLQRISE